MLHLIKVSKYLKGIQSYSLIILGIALFSISVAILGNIQFLNQFDFELNDNQYKFVSTLVQLIGGILILIGLIINSNRVKELARQNHINEQGKITERFKDSIGFLESKSALIRLGGIYSLHKIAQDSPTDRTSILSILCFYIRESEHIEVNKEIQSILDLITKSNIYNSNEIDLGKANLKRANFYGANLKGANLSHTLLDKADLRRSQLDGAFIWQAHIFDASISHVSAIKTQFCLCKIAHSNFMYSNLTQADFGGSDLETVSFRHARLTETKFGNTLVVDTNFDLSLDMSENQLDKVNNNRNRLS
jgi:uncharacterized membrane protein YciS (DUF1049 family)